MDVISIQSEEHGLFKAKAEDLQKVIQDALAGARVQLGGE